MTSSFTISIKNCKLPSKINSNALFRYLVALGKHKIFGDVFKPDTIYREKLNFTQMGIEKIQKYRFDDLLDTATWFPTPFHHHKEFGVRPGDRLKYHFDFDRIMYFMKKSQKKREEGKFSVKKGEGKRAMKRKGKEK